MVGVVHVVLLYTLTHTRIALTMPVNVIIERIGEKMPKPPGMNPNYPHYMGGMPPELAAQYPGAPIPGHPGALNNYPPRPPLQMGFDAHPSMRGPPLASGLMLPGGKA